MTRLLRLVSKSLLASALGVAAALGGTASFATPPDTPKGGAVSQQEFVLTADQVLLLRQLRVVWVPIEAGAPVVDLEMPFGSTTIQSDVSRILGHPGGPADRSVAKWITRQHPDDELPAGLLQAVAVLVDAGTLQPGSYTIRSAARERIAAGKALSAGDDVEPRVPATPTFNFEVTGDHLKLFAHARFHGFGFDFKRPYGDMTYYWLDIANALGVKIPPQTADGYAFKPDEIARFDRLHGEMLFTLQAFLQYAKLEPGTYVSVDGAWTRKKTS